MEGPVLISLPLILIESNGDLTGYPTEFELVHDVEAIDVLGGEYLGAWSGDGNFYSLAVRSTTDREETYLVFEFHDVQQFAEFLAGQGCSSFEELFSVNFSPPARGCGASLKRWFLEGY